MVANAAPRPGDVYLRFNGQDSFVEIPSIADYSVATAGKLAVAAWIRPDTLNFPRWERTGYVHWLGKGERVDDEDQQEWVFRIYNRDNTTENPPRPNRVSFYVFNPDGRLGVGSYFQDPLQEGNWMFVVGVADTTRTYIYRDGRYRRCDTYRGPPDNCPIHFLPPPNDDVQLEINPAPGASPVRIGTRDRKSFFLGGVSRMRIWNRALGGDEVSSLYLSDVVPLNGLVGEFLLNADTGTTVTDTVRHNDGSISGAAWDIQR
jgi:hypothetical protein